MAPVDPDRWQIFPPGWDVVVEEALRDVQQVLMFQAEFGERGVEGTEVVGGGLVRADVLGGDDGGEGSAQPPVTAGEAVAVHVGDDNELVVAGQPGKRRRGIGERRPVGPTRH